jgi:hypothetical protein
MKWPTAISKVKNYTSVEVCLVCIFGWKFQGQGQYYKITVNHTNSPPTWTFPPTLLQQNSAVLLVCNVWFSPGSMWVRVTQLQLQFQELGALGSCGVACCFSCGNYQVNYLHRIISSQQQWSGRFLGITIWDPSVCESKLNRLHVDILRVFFIKLGIYSTNSSKLTGDCPAVSNFNQLFLTLNRSHVDLLWFSFIKSGYILQTLKWLVIVLQSWTSTGYFSHSTGHMLTSSGSPL